MSKRIIETTTRKTRNQNQLKSSQLIKDMPLTQRINYYDNGSKSPSQRFHGSTASETKNSSSNLQPILMQKRQNKFRTKLNPNSKLNVKNANNEHQQQQPTDPSTALINSDNNMQVICGGQRCRTEQKVSAEKLDDFVKDYLHSGDDRIPKPGSAKLDCFLRPIMDTYAGCVYQKLDGTLQTEPSESLVHCDLFDFPQGLCVASDPLMVDRSAAVRRVERVLERVFEPDCLKTWQTTYGVADPPVMNDLVNQVRFQALVTDHMQDICKPHSSKVPGYNLAKKHLKASSERKLRSDSTVCTRLLVTKAMSSLKSDSTKDVKMIRSFQSCIKAAQEGRDALEKCIKDQIPSVKIGNEVFKYYSGRLFQDLEPTADRQIISCTSNNHKQTLTNETIKSINIAMQCTTDLDVLQWGIGTTSYLLLRHLYHNNTLMQDHSETLNQLYQGCVHQPSFMLLNDIPLGITGKFGSKTTIQELTGLWSFSLQYKKNFTESPNLQDFEELYWHLQYLVTDLNKHVEKVAKAHNDQSSNQKVQESALRDAYKGPFLVEVSFVTANHRLINIVTNIDCGRDGKLRIRDPVNDPHMYEIGDLINECSQFDDIAQEPNPIQNDLDQALRGMSSKNKDKQGHLIHKQMRQSQFVDATQIDKKLSTRKSLQFKALHNAHDRLRSSYAKLGEFCQSLYSLLYNVLSVKSFGPSVDPQVSTETMALNLASSARISSVNVYLPVKTEHKGNKVTAQAHFKTCFHMMMASSAFAMHLQFGDTKRSFKQFVKPLLDTMILTGEKNVDGTDKYTFQKLIPKSRQKVTQQDFFRSVTDNEPSTDVTKKLCEKISQMKLNKIDPQIVRDTSESDLRKVQATVKQLHAMYKRREMFEISFLYFFSNHAGYSIIMHETSPADSADYFRAKLFLNRTEPLVVMREEQKPPTNRLSKVEALQHSIKATRSFDENHQLTAGLISYCVSIGQPHCLDQAQQDYGSIPSLPPLTLESEDFDRVFYDVNNKAPAPPTELPLGDVRVYRVMVLYIWLVLLGWVRREKISKTFAQFKHQLMRFSFIVDNVLKVLRIRFTDIEQFHQQEYAKLLNQNDHPIQKYIEKPSEKPLASALKQLHYDAVMVKDFILKKYNLLLGKPEPGQRIILGYGGFGLMPGNQQISADNNDDKQEDTYMNGDNTADQTSEMPQNVVSSNALN